MKSLSRDELYALRGAAESIPSWSIEETAAFFRKDARTIRRWLRPTVVQDSEEQPFLRPPHLDETYNDLGERRVTLRSIQRWYEERNGSRFQSELMARVLKKQPLCPITISAPTSPYAISYAVLCF